LRRLVLVLFSTLLALPLFGTSLEIHVMDSDLQAPLPGVTLSIPGQATVKTDVLGQAFATVGDARVPITATRDGYQSVVGWVEPEQTSLTLVMHLEGVVEGSGLDVERNREAPEAHDERTIDRLWTNPDLAEVLKPKKREVFQPVFRHKDDGTSEWELFRIPLW